MNWDSIIALSVLFIFLFIIYSKIRKQSLRETYDEIKELITGGKE